jgi:hypothetical protein
MKNKKIIPIILFLALAIGASTAFAGFYGYRHYRHPHYPRYHHYHHYHGGDLFLGAMLGLTLGAVILSPPPPAPVYVYREYPPTVIYRDRYVVPPNPDSTYGENSYTSNSQPATDPTCLQTREYTTKIIIDGKEVDAYGTKCLRPDGSWGYGPAHPIR